MPAHATSTPLAPPGSQMLFATAGGGPACPALADTSATFSPPTSPAALQEAAGSGGQKRPRQKTVAAEATRPGPLPPARRSADEATLPVDEEEGALTQPDNGPYLGISTSSEGRGPQVSNWIISVDFPTTVHLTKDTTVEIKHLGNGGGSWEDAQELHSITLGRASLEEIGPNRQCLLPFISAEHAEIVWK